MFSHLTEEVPRQLFLQYSLLCDEVEEILARVGSLHDDDETVGSFEVINEFDDSRTMLEYVEQTDLKRNTIITNLNENIFKTWFDGWQLRALLFVVGWECFY